MIHGIGTDIAEVSRFEALLGRHGERALEKLLAPVERSECGGNTEPARFLAKRFAAKEALGKAFGTGIRKPLLLPEISIGHDSLGKPCFAFSPVLAKVFAERRLKAHLSLSDERMFVIAFVVLEQI